jgi:hypothetical protein
MGLCAHRQLNGKYGNLSNLKMKRFDIRKIRKLAARERYGELYFHWRKAEHMIASNLPDVRRYGRRLKRRVERLYREWFGAISNQGYATNVAVWSAA